MKNEKSYYWREEYHFQNFSKIKDYKPDISYKRSNRNHYQWTKRNTKIIYLEQFQF